MDLKFLRGLKANLDKVAVINGQILFTTDTKEMFLDTLDGRIEIADTQALAATLAQYRTTNDAAVKKVGDNLAALAEANEAAFEEITGDLAELATFIGVLPDGATAATIVDYINEKTSGIITDAALEELQEAVDALEEESAKHAFKTDVEAMYTNEQIDALVKGAKDYADANDADTKYGITYDSDAKKIKLVEGGTALEIDATAFIKDGMIDTVTLDENNDLVITFNTEAGKDAIVLPLDKLIDVYTGKTTADIIVTTDGNEISATLTEAVKASLAKADVAEQNAKDYADGLNTAMGARVKDLEDNKAGYATTGQVATAKQEATNTAAADATGKANAAQAAAEKKAAELDTALHTAISAEIDADVKALADGAVKTNTDDIKAIKTALTWSTF